MYVDFAGLKLAIYSQGSQIALLLPSPLESWVYRRVLPHLVYVVLQMEPTDLCLLGKHIVY